MKKDKNKPNKRKVDVVCPVCGALELYVIERDNFAEVFAFYQCAACKAESPMKSYAASAWVSWKKKLGSL